MATRTNHGMRASQLACVLGMAVWGQTAMAAEDAAGKDPGLVILRTVHPRTAYRQIPKEDMPVHTEATTFPLRTFGAHMDVLAGAELVDGQALDERGSAGVGLKVQAATGTFGTMLVPQGSSASAAGATPVGMGASIGGAVGGATAGIGGTVQNAMSGLMGAINTATGGGGGP